MLRDFVGALAAFIIPLVAFLTPSVALAVTPSEQLLPATTRGYLSIADLDRLRANFGNTQLGQLVSDEQMQPFADSFADQIRERFDKSGRDIALTWEDIENVHSGEVAIALLQPGSIRIAQSDDSYAMAVLVDSSTRTTEAFELLKKVDANLKSRKAKLTVETIGNHKLNVYKLPRVKLNAREVATSLADGQLIICSHLDTARGMLNRLNDEQVANDALPKVAGKAFDNIKAVGLDLATIASISSVDLATRAKIDEPMAKKVSMNARRLLRLSDLPSFTYVMSSVEEASSDREPDLRWFAEPFGLVNVVRASNRARNEHAVRKRAQDNVKIMASQGFDAIQGVGGHVNLMTEDHEALHRTQVYAPGEKGATLKYRLAANMLRFPNGDPLSPQKFVPDDVGTYASVNWKMKEAFGFVDTLVDALAGAEGFFDDFLAGLKDDPNGPQVNIEKDFVAHLAERATMISDHVLPITTQSERMLGAIEITDANAVRKFLALALDKDPNAKKHVVEGLPVWEMVTGEDDEEEELDVADLPGFDAAPGADEEEEEGDDERLLRNSALAVVGGSENDAPHLLVSNNLEFLTKVMRTLNDPEAKTLTDAVDYRAVMQALTKVGAGVDSARKFSRTDLDIRPTYELIRQGKMPESQTFLGRILNRLLGPEEGLREQRIDGRKLPEFDLVKRYLGPNGLYVRSHDDGWLVTGLVLKKQPQMAVAERATGSAPK